MATTHTQATVTFSDGSTREFSRVVVHDNRTLEATVRREFGLSVPDGVQVPSTDLSWQADISVGVVEDTLLFNSAEWLTVSQRPHGVLCALVHDPTDLNRPHSLVRVEDDVAHDFDVAERIRVWLAGHVEGWGRFFATDRETGKESEGGSGQVSRDRGRALDAEYVVIDGRLSGARERGHVTFWLALPPAPVVEGFDFRT